MMTIASPIICNGTPKSGTHALLQAVEAIGFEKYAFVRALPKDQPCYARRINYNEESIFLSQQAKRNFDNYLKNTPKVQGYNDVSRLLHGAPSRIVVHGHVCWNKRALLRGMTTVTIIRDPRDNFLSWARWFGPSASDEFFSTYASFTSWRKDNLFIYERLWEPDHIIALGNTLGHAITSHQVNEIVHKSHGKSLTWTNKPSNHQSVWNSDLDSFWRANHGEWLDAAYEQIASEWQADRFH
ncbi:hypothetical protein [Rhizobium sp. BR 362]|uniref:hypothetical protein n=1 Tax=Rhizobium sp. BR 362 TaxID=3040670 RepID=UPI002F3EE674